MSTPFVRPRLHRPILRSGFSLVELVVLISIIGILAAYVLSTSASSPELSLPSQADKLASDLRHAQTLALTGGKRMRVTLIASGANGRYGLYSCASSACSTSTLVDQEIVVANGVLLTGPSAVDFMTNGEPVLSNGDTFSMTIAGSTKSVKIAAVTGHVTVTP